MAEDTGLTAEGPVWGYFAAEGTKMLGYVVVERAEPVRIIALQCEDFVIADGLLRPGAASLLRGGQQGLYLCVRSAHAAADGLYPPGSGQPEALLRGSPGNTGETKKNPLAFFPVGMLS